MLSFLNLLVGQEKLLHYTMPNKHTHKYYFSGLSVDKMFDQQRVEHNNFGNLIDNTWMWNGWACEQWGEGAPQMEEGLVACTKDITG